jgi:hypothetical protein
MNTSISKLRKRGGGPRPLAYSIKSNTKAIFGKRGLADGAILTDWKIIAGEYLAAHSQPEQIAYSKGNDSGSLHLRIDSGSMATEMQHLQPLLIERINSYFGFKAIDRIKVTQGPLPTKKNKQQWSPRNLDFEEESKLAQSLMDVQDDDLREVLKVLGRAVIGRT